MFSTEEVTVCEALRTRSITSTSTASLSRSTKRSRNQPLHLTGAAGRVFGAIILLLAAPAGELGRSGIKKLALVLSRAATVLVLVIEEQL